MTAELEKLFPVGKELKVKDVTLTIKPFKFGELPRVFKTIDPISGALFNAFGAGQNQITAIAKLIADGGDSVIDLMVIGSKQTRQWIEELEQDEGIDILTAVLEVNASFFVQKVLPKVNTTLEALTKQTGLTS